MSDMTASAMNAGVKSSVATEKKGLFHRFHRRRTETVTNSTNKSRTSDQDISATENSSSPLLDFESDGTSYRTSYRKGNDGNEQQQQQQQQPFLAWHSNTTTSTTSRNAILPKNLPSRQNPHLYLSNPNQNGNDSRRSNTAPIPTSTSTSIRRDYNSRPEPWSYSTGGGGASVTTTTTTKTQSTPMIQPRPQLITNNQQGISVRQQPQQPQQQHLNPKQHEGPDYTSDPRQIPQGPSATPWGQHHWQQPQLQPQPQPLYPSQQGYPPPAYSQPRYSQPNGSNQGYPQPVYSSTDGSAYYNTWNHQYQSNHYQHHPTNINGSHSTHGQVWQRPSRAQSQPRPSLGFSTTGVSMVSTVPRHFPGNMEKRQIQTTRPQSQPRSTQGYRSTSSVVSLDNAPPRHQQQRFPSQQWALHSSRKQEDASWSFRHNDNNSTFTDTFVVPTASPQPSTISQQNHHPSDASNVSNNQQWHTQGASQSVRSTRIPHRDLLHQPPFHSQQQLINQLSGLQDQMQLQMLLNHQEIQKTPEHGSNEVTMKPKGILKNSDPAPIQPIVQAMLNQHQQQQQSRTSENGSYSQVQDVDPAIPTEPVLRSILKQSQSQQQDSYAEPVQMSNSQSRIRPEPPKRNSLGNTVADTIPSQSILQDDYNLMLAQSNPSQNGSQTHNFGQQQYQQYQQQQQYQQHAMYSSSNMDGLDMAGPHTRSRRRASNLGRADNTFSNVMGNMSTIKNTQLIDNNHQQFDRSWNFPGQPPRMDNDGKSVVSTTSALTKSTTATTTSTSMAILQSPYSVNRSRYAGGYDDSRSIVSTASAPVRVMEGGFVPNGFSARNRQVIDTVDAKSAVSFVTQATLHSRDSTSGKSQTIGDAKSVVSAASSVHSRRSFNGTGTKHDEDGKSVVSAGSVISRGSYANYASSASRKHRSASAPRIGRYDDDDVRSIMSSGSALTRGSHNSTGSRRSHSSNRFRRDEEDTRSVVTTSSSRSRPVKTNADDDDGKSVMTDARSVTTSQTRGSVRSASSNRSEHRPAPNAWDVDRKPSARRLSMSDDEYATWVPKTPAQKKKESVEIALELRDKVVSSLLVQQGIAEPTANVSSPMLQDSDFLVAKSSSGQVSADLKKFALRVQMGSLRHQLDESNQKGKSNSGAILIPPTPPFTDASDKRNYIDPFAIASDDPMSMDSSASKESFNDMMDKHVGARIHHRDGSAVQMEWTPVDSTADSLSDSGAWSPAHSNPRAKLQKQTIVDTRQSPSNSSIDELEVKTAKKKKKKTKEGKTKETSHRKRRDAVARIALELKPTTTHYIGNEQEIRVMANQSDSDDPLAAWTNLNPSSWPSSTVQPLKNTKVKHKVKSDPNVKSMWPMDFQPDRVETMQVLDGRAALTTEMEHQSDDQPLLVKPHKSAKKSKRKEKLSLLQCEES